MMGSKNICLVPIVNGVRVAKVITNSWKKYDKIPDAFIVEGPEAGGHLGFDHDGLVAGSIQTLEELATEVIEFANQFNPHIPVIVAGGVYTGADIEHYRRLGATGVQMATRFVTTKECDVSDEFKQATVMHYPKILELLKVQSECLGELS